jgi:hypothetical protein
MQPETQFEHLKRWELPQSYAGAHWDHWYAFLGRTRDSKELTESNFETGLAAVRAVASKEPVTDETGEDSDMDTVQVVRENHWACGWVEWIAIHESDTAALMEAERLLARLENYPVLDEEDWSRREQESAEQIWRDCYSAKERVKYIREHRSQFEFQSLADALGCVRGRYFAGYASELLN